MADDRNGMSGRDLQNSQSGGSSGYGSSQDIVNQQDRQAKSGQPIEGSAKDGPAPSAGQSRGELYDEIANGGRGPESISPDEDEIARDQEAHQDRGQSDVEFEREQS